MKRIIFAFLITIVGIALSWQFLRPKEWSSSNSNRQVVARVLSIINEVNRQETGRLLWSPIRKGDEIYLNDKIKTSGLSSIVIQLVDSASKLEIEENSTVVMAKGEKKLALDMLEGRVFIEQQEENVDLMSGGKKLDVSGNAAISVSKTGESQVESFENVQDTTFSELTPAYSADILSLKNVIPVRWKPTTGTEQVIVLIGESPLLLKKVEGVTATLSQGAIAVPFKPGLNYWQLVATVSGREVKSPLMKLNLTRPLPPTPLFPSDKELIRVGDRPFDFKWSKGNVAESVLIEVSKTASFKEVYLSEEIKDQTFFTPTATLTPGEYFWRVKSKTAEGEWLESKTNSFLVHVGSNFISPTPVYPQDNAVFYIGPNATNNVRFEWKKQERADSYSLLIAGEGINKTAVTIENTALVNVNKVGKYYWEVMSEGSDGAKSVLPVRRNFEVRQAGSVKWQMNQATFTYLDSLPIVILKWEKNIPGISVLKISSYQDFRDPETFQVQGRDFPYRVQKDGIFFARVSVVDETGAVAAESDTFEFTVKEAPLPPAPIFAGDKKLVATPEGELRAEIRNSKPSWLIIVSITDASGRVIDERRFSDEKLSFSGLMPGRYVLLAKFQDEYRRSGELSERIEVEVPEKSKIRAPKVKGIKVR